MEWLRRLFGKSAPQPQTTAPVDPLGGAFAETLAKGLGQILEGGEFKPVSTKSPEDAVSALFDKALEATPNLSIDTVKSHYDRLKGPWSSQKLFQGSRDKLRSIVLANLRRIKSEPGFRGFEVSVELTQGAARIYATVPPYAIPISVWRAGENYLACGNSDFRG